VYACTCMRGGLCTSWCTHHVCTLMWGDVFLSVGQPCMHVYVRRLMYSCILLQTVYAPALRRPVRLLVYNLCVHTRVRRCVSPGVPYTLCMLCISWCAIYPDVYLLMCISWCAYSCEEMCQMCVSCVSHIFVIYTSSCVHGFMYHIMCA
jgi:hypothetical protein